MGTEVLAELEVMPANRRARLAWFAAQWLARGMTVAALCDELGIVRQTGYRWMDELTALFGEQLYDPQARVELQTALAETLPAWQAQTTTSPAEPPIPVPEDARPDAAPILDAGVGRLFYPLVALDHRLDDQVSDIRGARATGQPGEVLVPAAIDPHSLNTMGEGLAVYGPSSPLESIGESLRLTRRAADLLSQDRAPVKVPESGIVAVAEFTGLLAIAGTPLLTQLAIEGTLQPLADLEAGTRLPLAQTLLDWLLTGEPAHQIAERTGTAVNTVYSRLRRARILLGDTLLTDPYRRLELTLALHAVVPRWRQQAGR